MEFIFASICIDDAPILQYQSRKAYFSAPRGAQFDAALASPETSLQRAMRNMSAGIHSLDTSDTPACASAPSPSHLDLLIAAAATLGISVQHIQAVVEVESNGGGFLASGRPSILFERHVFYRRLSAHGLNPASLAERFPLIVMETPGGYLGGEQEHVRLQQAIDLHASSAYESTSWGAFQIMGYHWKTMGYASVDEFVACMRKGYAQHLVAFVRFIAADERLRLALVNKDWTDFARRYNGPAYAKHAYHVRIAEAYEQLASAVDDAA